MVYKEDIRKLDVFLTTWSAISGFMESLALSAVFYGAEGIAEVFSSSSIDIFAIEDIISARINLDRGIRLCPCRI